MLKKILFSVLLVLMVISVRFAQTDEAEELPRIAGMSGEASCLLRA